MTKRVCKLLNCHWNIAVRSLQYDLFSCPAFTFKYSRTDDFYLSRLCKEMKRIAEWRSNLNISICSNISAGVQGTSHFFQDEASEFFVNRCTQSGLIYPLLYVDLTWSEYDRFWQLNLKVRQEKTNLHP